MEQRVRRLTRAAHRSTPTRSHPGDLDGKYGVQASANDFEATPLGPNPPLGDPALGTLLQDRSPRSGSKCPVDRPSSSDRSDRSATKRSTGYRSHQSLGTVNTGHWSHRSPGTPGAPVRPVTPVRPGAPVISVKPGTLVTPGIPGAPVTLSTLPLLVLLAAAHLPLLLEKEQSTGTNLRRRNTLVQLF